MAPTEIATPEAIVPSVLISPLAKANVGVLAEILVLIVPEFVKVPPAIVLVKLLFSCNVFIAVIFRPPLKVVADVKRRYPIALPLPRVIKPPEVVVRDEITMTLLVLVEMKVPPFAPTVTELSVTSDAPPATLSVPPLTVMAPDERLVPLVPPVVTDKVPPLIVVPPV